jgi:hypothetical protein
MKKNIVIATLLFTFLILGCNKSQQSSQTTNKDFKKNSGDLVFVNDKSIDYGFYNSTVVDIGETKQVWLHIPEASKDSKVDLERASEILAEISCKLRQIKFLKITDVEGKKILESGNEKWDSPSPVTTLYKIILKVCEVAK